MSVSTRLAVFRWALPALAIVVMLSSVASGCTDESPDTSAPERIEIDRAADWTGALLYIADGEGPVSGWGSIRIYDNVSGFVEATVEQTFAANPSDLYVIEGGSKMYVSSMANGIVDIFFWDGNGWHRGTRTVDTPSTGLLAMELGPDKSLYLAGDSAEGSVGALYRLDMETDKMDAEPVLIANINQARGIAWSADKTRAFVTGRGPGGQSLQLLSWPSAEPVGSVSLPVMAVNQVELAPDGLTLYIACVGQILTADPISGAVTGSLNPAADPAAEYFDVAFSADGRFMFAPASLPTGDTTLYVVELATGAIVNQVTHVSIKANGIKRIE